MKQVLSGIVLFVLFSSISFVFAVDPANHNTSRSNKSTGGICSSSVVIDGVQGEFVIASGPDIRGHVTLIKMAGDTSSDTSEEATENCINPANHNTSRSNKTPGGIVDLDTSTGSYVSEDEIGVCRTTITIEGLEGEYLIKADDSAENDSIGHVTLIKASEDNMGDIGEDADNCGDIKDNVGHVTLIRTAGDTSGGASEEDADGGINPVNHNTSRSSRKPGGIAADFLASEGIIVDHKDNPELYELDNDIQRQAVIKIVMKLSGREITDVCRGEFSDVDTNTWPCKYIEAALDAGYIAPNDLFRPFDKITITEAMKLVLKSKGIQKTQTTSNWQEDYMMTAYEYGIIDEKYYNYNDNATRGWIFQIATATIQKEDEIFEKGGIISDEADTE